jgi:hypothetical protein
MGQRIHHRVNLDITRWCKLPGSGMFRAFSSTFRFLMRFRWWMRPQGLEIRVDARTRMIEIMEATDWVEAAGEAKIFISGLMQLPPRLRLRRNRDRRAVMIPRHALFSALRGREWQRALCTKGTYESAT